MSLSARFIFRPRNVSYALYGELLLRTDPTCNLIMFLRKDNHEFVPPVFVRPRKPPFAFHLWGWALGPGGQVTPRRHLRIERGAWPSANGNVEYTVADNSDNREHAHTTNRDQLNPTQNQNTSDDKNTAEPHLLVAVIRGCGSGDRSRTYFNARITVGANVCPFKNGVGA